MNGIVGVLLFALATPAQLPATGQPAVPHKTMPRASAPSSLSFEQISQRALEAWNDGRDDDAIRLFESGLKLKPDWDEGLWYLGATFYEKKRFGEARDLLRRYVAQNPKHGPAWALLGLCEYSLREYDRALDHLQRADSLGLQGRKELADAVSYHEILLLTRSGQFGAARKSIWLYLERGADAQSLEVPMGLNVLGYQLLPEEVPSDRREFARRMGAALLLGRVKYRREVSKDMLRELVREHPEEQGTHLEYGALLLEDELPEGVEEMKKVLAISPSHVDARLQLAQYYVARSQLEQARLYVDEA
jgi:tetratricopeptide (TPR) repeat protein